MDGLVYQTTRTYLRLRTYPESFPASSTPVAQATGLGSPVYLFLQRQWSAPRAFRQLLVQPRGFVVVARRSGRGDARVTTRAFRVLPVREDPGFQKHPQRFDVVLERVRVVHRGASTQRGSKGHAPRFSHRERAPFRAFARVRLRRGFRSRRRFRSRFGLSWSVFGLGSVLVCLGMCITQPIHLPRLPVNQ